MKGTIKVVDPVNRFFFEIEEEFTGDFGETSFGVTHGGRTVAIDRAKVALTVNQHIAHREILGQTGEGIVDGGITMGVVLTQYFSHDSGTFLVFGGRQECELLHAKEDTTVDRLEPIARIG
ncbi:MAG: hypothetical protein ACD_40C00084G0001 [uncultured bacterium]|nr:MAG: hypothetical protein ACD_40C00084G0001 [uncultured bacterium]